MDKIQVLVATMHRQDDSLAEQMNLRCDAVIANQADRNEVTERVTEYGTIKMVTTETRGVGVNRNIALREADADILLFADDDMTYYDGTLQGVCEAFQQNPDADVIVFGLDYIKDGQIFDRRRVKAGRVRLWQALKYGACRLAVRSESVRRTDVRFNLRFGGGTVYGSGEDTIFIRECFRKGLRVYGSSYVLGTCCKDSSSWFRGFDEKFFFDKGALYACAFPRMKQLVSAYFALKFARKTSGSALDIYRTMGNGWKAFSRGMSYEEYTQKRADRET